MRAHLCKALDRGPSVLLDATGGYGLGAAHSRAWLDTVLVPWLTTRRLYAVADGAARVHQDAAPHVAVALTRYPAFKPVVLARFITGRMKRNGGPLAARSGPGRARA